MTLDFLKTTKVLEEVESPVNGKIRVVRSLGFGTYIQVENLTQSGGVVYDVWRTTLRAINKQHPTINNCLILGLGGGSAAALVRKYWPASPNRGEPEAKITGVDSDPIMVKLGKKYLGLRDVDTFIEDGMEFCKKESNAKKKYDLILVDMYVGHTVPKKFESEEFIKFVKDLLGKNGLAIFNRLYYAEKRPEAIRFAERLEKTFSKVNYIYPEANVMLICSR